jgi:hypothetical protein
VLQAVKQTAAEAEVHTTTVPEELPMGGFTDVGLHTGGMPRDTAWPLVRVTIKVMEGGGGIITLLVAE